MKKTILFLSFISLVGGVIAQKVTTTSAVISFDATTPKDALPKADNKTVIGSIDTKTGDVAFEAAVKNFTFSNPKIQEHFNSSNWMNSDQFPKFSFKGKIQKANKIKFTKDGTYNVKAEGTLTVKGIDKPAKAEGTITVANGKISVMAEMKVKLEDYNISGQPIEAGKVAKEPRVTVSAQF